MPFVADLYLPESGTEEVVLDVGGKLELSPTVKDAVSRVSDSLQRNETMVSYRGRRSNGGKLVLECDEIDYATNLAMLKGLIPREGLTPVGALGLPEITEGIAVGVLSGGYSSGKVQGIPAGMINLDELKPETMRILDGFYNELFEETGLQNHEVSGVRFLGMVYDRQHNQLAAAYRYETGMDHFGFSMRMGNPLRHHEYSHTIPLSKYPAALAFFALSESHLLPVLPHCKGAVMLYGLQEFPGSGILNKLMGKEGRIFGYF